METLPQLLALLGFGFLLGLQHAADPDHLVAVTALTARQTGLRRSAWLGALWGLGHTTTLFLAGGAVLWLQLAIPARLALAFELVVGLVIIGLGARLLWELVTGRIHRHEHEHDGVRHDHLHSHQREAAHRHGHLTFVTGLVHGLAGSAALSLLALSTAPSVTQGTVFLVVFGLGSVAGMFVLSGLLFLPLRFANRAAGVQLGLRTGVGVASVGFGSWLVWSVGVSQGLLV